MPARRPLRPPHRPLAALLIGWALAGGAVAAGPPIAASGPASNPSRSTTMASNEAGGEFTVVQLKDLVAEHIGPWTQTGLDVPLESTAMPQPASLVYTYRHGKHTATLTLTDGGVESSAPGPAHWTGPPNRRKTDRGNELVYREGRHTVREIERNEAPAREVMVLLANGILVTAAGDADMKALKGLAEGVRMDAAEGMLRAKK